MKHLDASQAINQLASARKPFLFLVDFEMEKIKIWEAGEIPEGVLFQLGPYSNYSSYTTTHSELALEAVKAFPMNKYLKAFERVQEEIHYGNSFLLNLTAKSRVYSKLSLHELFLASEAPYKFLFDKHFVCFSPESFIKINDNCISSFPMKGTIDADIDNAVQIILADEKEKAEHNTIVDLIRNDMSRYAKNVHVHRFRYIDKIETPEKNLLQVSSEVRGDLPENYHDILGDIIFSQLPAGSISGAPKHKTLDIIKEVEEGERSYYTGVAGFYDGKSLDSCVLIRYIEYDNGQLYYRSGGGITFMSKAEEEYKELLQKIYVPTS